MELLSSISLNCDILFPLRLKLLSRSSCTRPAAASSTMTMVTGQVARVLVVRYPLLQQVNQLLASLRRAAVSSGIIVASCSALPIPPADTLITCSRANAGSNTESRDMQLTAAPRDNTTCRQRCSVAHRWNLPLILLNRFNLFKGQSMHQLQRNACPLSSSIRSLSFSPTNLR